MSIKIASHLYRNRHGTFYFRINIPADLRAATGRHDVRISLGTEQRRSAIISALPLVGDLSRMIAELRQMNDTNEPITPNYFKNWKVEQLQTARLRIEIAELKAQIDDQSAQIESQSAQIVTMVPRVTAKHTVKQAHTLGQLRGREALETALMFPWSPERTQPFSALMSAYLASFADRPKGGRRKPIGEKTRAGYEVDIQLFVKVMGDLKIGSINREIAGKYFSFIRRLPANMNRVALYRDKTVQQLLAIKPPPPPQSEVNASKKMERISGMYKWALLEKHTWGIDANPFEGFGQSGDQETPRRPFSAAELHLLLSHPSYATRRFQKTYAYWLIPLALFTGARLGELCQLDVKDFVMVEGIQCIDINDVEGGNNEEKVGRKKRVKTKNARRLVPIHAELIRLGLMREVERMRARRQLSFFPELSRIRRDGPAHAASNWFQRLRKTVGITEKQATVFHSFRHLFITNLLDGNVPPHQVAPIVGHEANLVTGKVYWDTKDATKRLPTVAAFKIDQNVIDLLPAIEEVVFTAASGPRVQSRDRKKGAVG